LDEFQVLARQGLGMVVSATIVMMPQTPGSAAFPSHFFPMRHFHRPFPAIGNAVIYAVGLKIVRQTIARNQTKQQNNFNDSFHCLTCFWD
jgi:hypothetical protein